MENNGPVELSDDELDAVAGGECAADFSECKIPNHSIVRNIAGRACWNCELHYERFRYEAKFVCCTNGEYKKLCMLTCTKCGTGYYGSSGTSAKWVRDVNSDREYVSSF
ncbi:MAG: hypothetical protein IKB88_08805 [Clostridia bacterium]|nr:hypothetical protein [Clostridia bacterium]